MSTVGVENGVHVLSVIRFSDETMREGHGNYQTVCSIMQSDGVPPGAWMLRSDVTIVSSTVASDWLLHFWNDGRVVIKATNRPMLVEVPDDDVRELSEFFRYQGWKTFEVDNLLLEEPQGFDFWLRLFQAKVVESDIFTKHEENETKRFEKAFAAEEEMKDAD